MFPKGKGSLGEKYKPTCDELIPRYKCISFKSQLHPSVLECSGINDGGVKCKVGRASSSKAPLPPQKPQQHLKSQNQRSLSSPFVTKTASKTVATKKQPAVKGKPTIRKCGRYKISGAELQSKNTDWYAACEKYIGLQVKMSRA